MSLANDELVIFDIREKAEYAVSHLDNAILVSPDMSAGGLFNWVNEQRSISGKGIHPYNDEWGKFVKDKDMLRYTP